MDLLPSAHVDSFARDRLPAADRWPELRFDLDGLHYPDQLNCAGHLLDTAIAAYGPDRKCLISNAETWTYGDLDRHSDQIAHVLTAELGVVPGNRVLICGPNSPWTVACWFGVLKAGGVVVTVVPLLRSEEIATVAEIAQVSVALCAPGCDEQASLAGVAGMRVLTVGGKGPEDLVERCSRVAAGEFDTVRTSQDDVAMIAFTSGTTGRPKGCLHFHRDVLAIADTFAEHVLRARPDDVFTGSPPLGFTFGLGGLVIFPLHVGASTVLLERGSPEALLGAIEKHGVSVLFTAPTAYRAMLAMLESDSRSGDGDSSSGGSGEGGGDTRLSTLRRCVSAGEALPGETWRAWHAATGVKIIDGIGATELLHIFISAADDDIRPGSTGRPVPGWEAVILDAEGNPVPDGEPGLLAVRGPVGCRYLADERQSTYVRHGWNYTGDTYIRDADGYFWYQARSDDMIISSGYNIAGPEVENALLRHPSVLEAGVIGMPDADRGQLVTAFVVLRPEAATGEATVKELQEFVKARIAPYKYPRAVHFVPALPRTNTGKLQRFKLRDLL
ncbi:AMP-dependent synthetase and ligase [Catenulispora acidiphila DSM 44928]|uniref:AMP-dependent synthetase and ligase n=1 Tax=Catenulispora acidiphila (strain DSM 44928 / JCM 14897 / NBRC 102108 / NRRL B-24433 / ID139908) TaxID=479433 RepID=C7QAR0_CATAD|nr:AMP-binding protein [Catenulispora acidiphila]ACU74383.1 AMP-dependent synthetase and ligase [Catenulispora acidiphila DSM 44928]